MRGLGNWIFLVYAIGMTIINLVVLVWLFIRSPQQRWPAVLMIAGQIGVRVVYMLGVVQVIHPSLPIQVFAFWIPIPLYAIALFAFRIFDPIPLARQALIEQLRDGMLVLDLQGRVASLNPAASKILTTHRKHIQGKPVEEILPKLTELSSDLVDGGLFSKPVEMTIGLGAEAHCFELESSPLDDFRGIPVGCLIILRDVTEQHRSQAQILEQQRALTTLRERDWLARELHDNLAQELALINLQAQLVSGLLEAGQEEPARAQLQILAKAAREAQMDVRGEIVKLSLHVDPVGGFPGSLRNLTQAFQETYGIAVDLILPGDLDVISLAPTAEVQLLRIIQEAFANIRKHAGANHVHVSLAKKPGCVLLQIEDNGVGFDPDRLSTSHEAFGLGIMSQRAAEMGGRVEVHSVPGEGTKVIIEAPVNEEA